MEKQQKSQKHTHRREEKKFPPGKSVFHSLFFACLFSVLLLLLPLLLILFYAVLNLVLAIYFFGIIKKSKTANTSMIDRCAYITWLIMCIRIMLLHNIMSLLLFACWLNSLIAMTNLDLHRNDNKTEPTIAKTK